MCVRSFFGILKEIGDKIEMGDNNLLKNILSMDEAEDKDTTLVDMYHDLLFIGERLKNEVQAAIENDLSAKAKRAEEGEESEVEEEDEDNEEEDEQHARNT